MELHPASSKCYFNSLQTPSFMESKPIHDKYIGNNSTHIMLICMWINPIYGHKGRLCQRTESAQKTQTNRTGREELPTAENLSHFCTIWY